MYVPPQTNRFRFTVSAITGTGFFVKRIQNTRHKGAIVRARGWRARRSIIVHLAERLSHPPAGKAPKRSRTLLSSDGRYTLLRNSRDITRNANAIAGRFRHFAQSRALIAFTRSAGETVARCLSRYWIVMQLRICDPHLQPNSEKRVEIRPDQWVDQSVPRGRKRDGFTATARVLAFVGEKCIFMERWMCIQIRSRCKWLRST